MKSKDTVMIPTVVRVASSSVPMDELLTRLPLLTTRNLVLFPGVHVPLSITRQESLELLKHSKEQGTPVGVVCQRNPETESPGMRDIYRTGTTARVLDVIDLPDGTQTALIVGLDTFVIEKRAAPRGTDLKGVIYVKAHRVEEIASPAESKEIPIIVEHITKCVKTIAERLPDCPEFIKVFGEGITSMEFSEMINTLGTHLSIDVQAKQKLLETPDIKERALMLLSHLNEMEEKANLMYDLMKRASGALDGMQRQTFLQQQMEIIREELYGSSYDEFEKLTKLAENCAMPDEAYEAFKREKLRLMRTPPQTPDYTVALNYLETLANMPWRLEERPLPEIDRARAVLDADHFGLERVKDRILEQIAVMMNGPAVKAPILCLVGPPGVGKTSLGASVARALGRCYQRVSLGGVHDESEIRGHRRTYIGAMPGRIIKAMKNANQVDPVLLLDEIDKLASNTHGDPAAALLEVLDPEQNKHFHDNYLDVDYDLSHVLFIATANTLDTIPRPLLDRMEVIEISGYLPEEKASIARNHLVPKIYKEYCVEAADVPVSDEVIEAVISRYTSESGVRALEKQLRSLVRKRVLQIRTGKANPGDNITVDDLQGLLGVEPFSKERYEGNDYAGVATGLAWTGAGGDILYIETSVSPSKGEKQLTLTGNLGDVMKESAATALQYVKSHAAGLGIDSAVFERNALHIHVPEGAVPKDGPSAGITMVVSIVSALRQKRVKARVAMTGEITLRGRVLPVGGLKEKLLAARRAGITDIIVSEENRKNIDDIPAQYIEGLKIHYVTDAHQVVELAVTDDDPINPLTL